MTLHAVLNPGNIKFFKSSSYRNPLSEERPGFNAISYILRQPNSYLLSWGDTDRSVHPEATSLGADSRIGQLLYPDLQNIYNG